MNLDDQSINFVAKMVKMALKVDKVARWVRIQSTSLQDAQNSSLVNLKVNFDDNPNSFDVKE